MATPNSIDPAYPELPTPVSKQCLCVAGILVTVYGLAELSEENEEIACLWLLHPRLADQNCMQSIAYSTIGAWNNAVQVSKKSSADLGMIAISFDQRNHGSREIDPVCNQDWKSGNSRHAQDMFAGYHGTATDVSHLLSYISSYVFPLSEHSIIENIVCGVSLGGHAAWHCLMQDSRIRAGVVIVGCPDYITLMSERAYLSNLQTAGSSFLGSKDFPEQLLEAVRTYDPAGQLIGVDSTRQERFLREPISDERATITPIMYKSFQGKTILNLAGGADKLVPYSSSEPFLRWLKRAIASSGCFSDGELKLKDVIFDDVDHAFSPEMATMVDQFVVETLRESSNKAKKISRL